GPFGRVGGHGRALRRDDRAMLIAERSVKVPPMSIPTMLKTLSSESHRNELVVVDRLRLRHGGEDSELLERMPDHVDRRRAPGAVDRETRDLRVVDFGGDAGLDLDGL